MGADVVMNGDDNQDQGAANEEEVEVKKLKKLFDGFDLDSYGRKGIVVEDEADDAS